MLVVMLFLVNSLKLVQIHTIGVNCTIIAIAHNFTKMHEISPIIGEIAQILAYLDKYWP